MKPKVITPLRRRPRGVSLLEVLVTVAVVSIGMTSILTMTMQATAVSTLEQERARANQLVCQYMEEKVIFPPLPEISSGTQVTVWDNGTPNNPNDDTMGTIEIVAYDMKTGLQITSIPVNKMNRVRYRVEVTMNWHPRGARHSATFRETVMTYKVA